MNVSLVISGYKGFGHKQLLRLTGSTFVNSDKIQLWQHKVTPFPVKFWVWFGSFGTHKWSRNAGLALQFLKLVLEGEIGQNLAKLWQFEVKKPCNVSYQN